MLTQQQPSSHDEGLILDRKSYEVAKGELITQKAIEKGDEFDEVYDS